MSKLHEVKVHRLRPTQITVGMAEVREKQTQLAGLHHDQLRDFLAAHPIPAVEGPDDKLYITDHHHLARALLEMDLDSGFFLVEANFSGLPLEPFWQAMAGNHWVHPYDEHGVLRTFADIPKEVSHLKDDPYRSLAGFVRNAGGYRKTESAYAEFQWADFFRSHIDIRLVQESFAKAVERGVDLAQGEAARDLPGFSGSS